ncbi:geranylgeranyl pyrophosphate synthase [Brachybacterium sp. SGAir0954]|uniref:polyprenyl synthetase family protein n=1 Tax=Brachybacterium sp. SGAir0954 TaxID=2571029 RepID=UPI0010CD2044|nr:polyprenyl synthetase family protein [Brachybacterium sp. SGAir0954]QCR54189.1 geranylgeranyl pyrophosphate synthase [Brachybacterium sp. SGAir0954]
MTSAGPTGTTTAPQALDAQLVAAIAQSRERTFAAHRAHLGAVAPEAEELVGVVEDYLAGGKLLRPRFCFWGGIAALDRAPDEDEVSRLAALGTAIELVQAAALMHDDVIDHSPTRRGRPALHVEAATSHRERGLDGSAADFGIATAIVLGDLALSWSEQLAAEVASPGAGPRPAAAAVEFARLRTEVMSGQYLDVLHQAGGFTSAPSEEEAALAVIRWKTVPYTVLRPVRAGAALMGAGAEALELLSTWAAEIGTAFQLRDDLLSVVGDADATGKPIGGDVAEGKRTVLLARTVAATDAAGRRLLERTVGRPDAAAEDVTAVQELMVRTGAVDSVVRDVRAAAERARSILSRAAEGGELGALGVTGLQSIADSATDVESIGG